MLGAMADVALSMRKEAEELGTGATSALGAQSDEITAALLGVRTLSRVRRLLQKESSASEGGSSSSAADEVTHGRLLSQKLLVLLDSLARSSTVEDAPTALKGSRTLQLAAELSRYVKIVAERLSSEAAGDSSWDMDRAISEVRSPALQALSSLAVALAGATRAIEPFVLIARFGQAVARIRRGSARAGAIGGSASPARRASSVSSVPGDRRVRTGFTAGTVPNDVKLLDDDTTAVVANDSIHLPELPLDPVTGIQLAVPPAAGTRVPLLWGVGAACIGKGPVAGPPPAQQAGDGAEDAAAHSAATDRARSASGFDTYVFKAGPAPLAVGLVTPNPDAKADSSQPPFLPVVVWRDHVVQVHRPPVGTGAVAASSGGEGLSMPPMVRRESTSGAAEHKVATAALPLGHGLKTNSIVRVVVDPASRQVRISADGAGKPVVALSQSKPSDGTKASIIDAGHWLFDKAGDVQCELIPAVWLPSSMDSVFIRGSKSTTTAPGVSDSAVSGEGSSSGNRFLPSTSVAGKVLKPLRDLPWFDELCQLSELAREMGEGEAPHAVLRGMLPAYAASSMSVLVESKHPVSSGSAVWQRDVNVPGASALRVIFDRETKLADGEMLQVKRSDLGAAAAPLGMSTGAALPGS